MSNKQSKNLFPLTRRDALKAAGFTAGAFTIGLPLSAGSAAAATMQTLTVRSGTSSEVTGYRAGDDAGTFPTQTPNVDADLTWVHPLWSGTSHTFDTETRWIWHCDETSQTDQTIGGDLTYYVKEPIAGDVVELEETFSIPGTPSSGTLHITADNGYEVWVNGTHVGSAQVYDSGGVDWEDSDLGQPYINAQSGSWISVESIDVSSHLSNGSNTLTVVGGNEQQSTSDGEQNGTVTSNPGGVIYELDIEYEEQTCIDCSGDRLAKYEFACVQTDPETDECVAYDFVLEGSGDLAISYTADSFTSKDNEMYEPMSVTFETDYCELYVLVKSGQELEVQSFEDIADSFTVETANEGKYAISFVAIYCDLEDAQAALEMWSSRGRRN